MPDERIILVTPVWNDSLRLSRFGPKLANALKTSGLPVKWIISDDGSSLEEQKRLKVRAEALAEIYPDISLRHLARRTCKGGAVYAVWDSFPEADWLCFVDADGAISAGATLDLVHHAVKAQIGGACVGVRQHTKHTPVKRSRLRQLTFRIFNLLTRMLLGFRFRDTQCGLKVVSGPAYRVISGSLLERGLAFDLELLLALSEQGFHIEERPIPWQQVSGGKVHLGRDAWPMLLAVLRMRKRLKSGHYSAG